MKRHILPDKLRWHLYLMRCRLEEIRDYIKAAAVIAYCWLVMGGDWTREFLRQTKLEAQKQTQKQIEEMFRVETCDLTAFFTKDEDPDTKEASK